MFKYSATEDVQVASPKFFYFIEMKHLLKTRDGLLHFFTAVNRPILNVPKELTNKDFIKVYLTEEELKVISAIPSVFVPKEPSSTPDLERVEPTKDFTVYGIIPIEKAVILVKLTDNGLVGPFHPFDRFNLEEGMIDNYSGPAVVTDVGKFATNYILFADIFKDLIPYQNKKLSPGKTDTLVAEVIASGKADRSHYKRYMDQGYWFLENGGIFVSAFTEKALTTGDEVLAKKKELLAQYKDQLDNPDVLAKIEATLISMDKAYLKGDSSDIFMEACGKKAYKEARKKMFLTFGMSQSFGGKSGVKFTPNSFEEGWEPQYLANAANEVRRGSYGRGIETAKGGAESKFILRTFQETRITEDNCFDKRGMPVTFTEENINFYVDRYLTNGTLITEENKSQLIGKTFNVRSPMTCATKNGFCYQCCGEVFRKIGMTAIGMQALAITSSFTSSAMKSMHISSISTAKLTDIGSLLIKQ